MMRFLSPALRSVVAVALGASPALAQFEARVAPEAGVAAPASAAFTSPTVAAPRLPLALSAPALTPTLPIPFSAAASPAALAAPSAAAAPAVAICASAVPAAETAAAPSAAVAAPAAEPWAVPGGAAERRIHPAFSALPSAARPAARGVAARWNAVFDGDARAGATDEAPVAAVGDAPLERASTLAPAALSARAASAPVAAPRVVRSRTASRVAAGLAAVALFLFSAVPAYASGSAAPFTAEATLSVLAALHPAASAVGAVVGALYGMITAKRADGAAPNSGDVFASTMRYGVLGGAGVYVLLDLAQSAFTGFSVTALNPLSTALATAALGHTAFEGKFADPATSSADRIMSVFPSVAAAMGLTVNTLLGASLASWPVALHSIAAGAMSATGLAAALYAAFFTPGRSAPSGPARMAKGWVLQSLMGGLAFAVGSLWLSIPFALLAVWGFADAMFASGQELLSAAKALWIRWTAPPKA